VRKKGDKVMDLEENLKRELEKYIELYYTTLQLFSKNKSYRTFWCIMNLNYNIKKESALVRQNYYTTKTH